MTIRKDTHPGMASRIGYGWVVIGALALGNIFVVFTGFTLGILLPDIRVEFNLSPVQAGLLGSAFFLGFASFSFPSSLWLSRYRPRWVVLLLFAGSSLFLFLQAWSPVFWALLLGRFMFVLLSVGRSAPEMMLIHQWFESHRVARVMSVNFSILGIGQTLSLAFGPILLTLVGNWHNMYYLFGFGMLGATFVWYLLGKEHPDSSALKEQNGSLLAPMYILRQEPALWLVASCQVGAAITFASFMTFWPTFMIEMRDVPIEQAGPLFSLYPIGGILGSLSAGSVSELIGRRKPIIWVSGTALPFLYMALLITPNTIALGASLFCAGIFAFIVIPIVMTIPFDMGLQPREIALATGLTRTFTPLAATIGPILVGIVEQMSGSLTLGLALVVPMPLLMTLCGLMIPETSPHRHSENTRNTINECNTDA